MHSFLDFLLWEKTSRDTIDFKRIYVDMSGGDVLAGLMLSEIVYWHLPNANGGSKLRVQHDGKHWVAVAREEWWERIRFTPRMADRALKVLLEGGLIEKAVYPFDRAPTTHVRLHEENFMRAWAVLLPSANDAEAATMPPTTQTDSPVSSHQNGRRRSPNGEKPITDALPRPPQSVISITENTTTTTTQTTAGERPPPSTAIPSMVSDAVTQAEAYPLFKAWVNAHPERARGAAASTWEKKANRDLAVAMAAYRITPDLVEAVTKARLKGRKTSYAFSFVPEDVAAYLALDASSDSLTSEPATNEPAEARQARERLVEASYAALPLVPPSTYLPDLPEAQRQTLWEQVGRRAVAVQRAKEPGGEDSTTRETTTP